MEKGSTLLASCWRERLVETGEKLHSQMTRSIREGELGAEIIERVAEILTGVKTVEELAEIERAIQEIKGKLTVEQGNGFWEGKIPCWEMFRCPAEVKNKCPAFKNRSVPCWEVEGTYCKLFDYEEKGNNIDICRYCRVYKRWGNSEPIEVEVCEKELHAIG